MLAGMGESCAVERSSTLVFGTHTSLPCESATIRTSPSSRSSRQETTWPLWRARLVTRKLWSTRNAARQLSHHLPALLIGRRQALEEGRDPLAQVRNLPIVPNGMGHMDWVRDSWHQSRIVTPRRDLQRLASVQAVTRLSRLYLPGGTIPFFPSRPRTRVASGSPEPSGPPHQNRRTGTPGGSGIWRESELLRHIIASFHDLCDRFSYHQ